MRFKNFSDIYDKKYSENNSKKFILLRIEKLSGCI